MFNIDSKSIYRRDRVVVLAGLAGITILSWVYLIYMAQGMNALQMNGMSMPQWQPWSAVEFALMFLMWMVMMVAMMVPSASPMILTFTTVHRRQTKGDAIAPTIAFVTGYLIVWSTFSLVATLIQWGLHQTALLSPMMIGTSPILGGVLLIAAGAFQWSRLKQACLSKCRSPLSFLLHEWHDGS